LLIKCPLLEQDQCKLHACVYTVWKSNASQLHGQTYSLPWHAHATFSLSAQTYARSYCTNETRNEPSKARFRSPLACYARTEGVNLDIVFDTLSPIGSSGSWSSAGSGRKCHHRRVAQNRYDTTPPIEGWVRQKHHPVIPCRSSRSCEPSAFHQADESLTGSSFPPPSDHRILECPHRASLRAADSGKPIAHRTSASCQKYTILPCSLVG